MFRVLYKDLFFQILQTQGSFLVKLRTFVTKFDFKYSLFRDFRPIVQSKYNPIDYGP